MNQIISNTIFTFIKKNLLLLITVTLLISSCKKETNSKPNDDISSSGIPRELFYISNNNNIYSMDENGNNVQQLTYYNNDNFISHIDYSRTTDKILFSKFHVDTTTTLDLFTMDSNGSNLIKITNNNYRGSSPFFSNDGSKIIFTTRTDHGTSYSSNIFSINSDGSNLTNITNFSDSANNWIFKASWSPNDSSILFYGDSSGQSPGIYFMKNDGSNVTRVPTGDLEVHYSMYSPDGSKVLFIAQDSQNTQVPKTNIYTVNIDGSQLTNITNFGSKNHTIDVNNPNWSKDGKKITFMTDKDFPPTLPNRQELYIMDSDGSNQVRITNDSISQNTPVWK